MSESAFRRSVVRWCEKHLQGLAIRRPSLAGCGEGRLTVTTARIYGGEIPWRYGNRRYAADWVWKEFTRDVDVSIGIRVNTKYQKLNLGEMVIPIIVIELKSGGNLNSDELDKKSAIYGPLSEIYPWVHRVLVHEDMSRRGLGEAYIFRNARQFNTILTEWDDRTKEILGNLIDHQIDYLLCYWGF